MIECLILGDSIAQGVSQIRTECVTLAQSGINSHDWVKKFIDKIQPAKTVIISLGSNDLLGVNTQAELTKIRNSINTDRVYWIVPAIKPMVQDIVQDVAYTNQDTIVYIKETADQVHPTGREYRRIAQSSK